ncbi:bacillithiol biosynthesis cysteine-adding enzyme BshC [Bacillus sp. REN10]|uniref:bacillithiol biosynthesis cysteine-adding enzyme BshC n=1 Tax=Bacillus sp. REN10 TaxID=2782541 RepID=UPI00193B0FE9|nr:bacillithiol biosynthesis cysteine-adding enzyme BshC [Bacillus sp. REN10]
MELERISIPAINQFASLYLKQEAPVTDFFHYQLTKEDVYRQRVADLHSRSFMRESLASCIESYMEALPKSEAVASSLRKLKDERSTVVIGGQQAGLLTGPLYTIYKVISIIKLAEEKEKELDIPVVPVFWIAGEDHDFLEVNHVYVESKQRMEKKTYPERVLEKRMVSDIELDHQQMKRWVKKIFANMEETEYTNKLLLFVNEAIDRSKTITDFFMNLVHSLFSEYGLLIIDAAYPPLRRLETPFFHQLIERAEEITSSVQEAQQTVMSYSFKQMIELSPKAANLFIYENNERMLLEYDLESGLFIGKSGSVRYSKDELLHLLECHPERFSNNVVTRPLMQEWLFPTLAFIAGPGEIAYWAELKKAFERFEMKMPPIEARLNMTLIERSIASDLLELNISVVSALMNGVQKEQEAFWESVKDEHFHELIASVQTSLMNHYDMFEERAKQLHKGTLSIIQKNRQFHLQQLQFLERKTDEMLKRQHDDTLSKYSHIQNALKPDGAPQERMWNVFYFLNKYGLDFIDELMKLTYVFNGDHQVVKI